MDKFELQKLRDLPIEGVAERLGLQVTRHKCLCPFHDDHHASLSFSLRRNSYRCFACGAHGGTIDLVMGHLGKDFKEACRWLGLTPAPIPEQSSPTRSLSPVGEGNRSIRTPLPLREGSGVGLFDASRFARFFEHPFLSVEARKFLFEERRLDPRVVRWCRLTSWRDKQGVPWLQTPYFNREGKLIGVQNRNLGKSPSGDLGGPPPPPRFRFPAGSECSIYNLPVLNLLKPGDELYIAEGCSDCWSLLSAGHKAIAIPSATLLTWKDRELLSALSSSPQRSLTSVARPSPSGERGEGLTFHMYPDNDTPGERLFLQLQQVLPNLVHHQLPPGCKDFSEYYVSVKRKEAEHG